jgi:hypothetical protein
MVTKVKKDQLGLYVIAGGYITRPFWGTCFNEGDEVKTHHFGGSTRAGVTVTDKKETHNFKRDGQYEYWCTTGLCSTKYKRGEYTLEEIEKQTEWYSKDMIHVADRLTEANREFSKTLTQS